MIGTETDAPTKEQLRIVHKRRITEDIPNDINSLNNEDVDILTELHEYIQNGKIEVRVFTKTKFHAKAYLFKREDNDTIIVGSSNLFLAGLGKTEDSNTELNLVQKDVLASGKLYEWFEYIWETAEPYKDGSRRYQCT